jgi:2-oxoglutarate ferredoxin oxidoreductase subunit beta
MVTKSTPEGVIENPINPISLALAAGATFIARGFSGDAKGLAVLFQKGIEHKGFALIDVLSPCVTYNKINTYDWFRQRVYSLEKEGHDPSSLTAAWGVANSWPNLDQKRDRIPLGVFFQRSDIPTYEDLEPALRKGPPVRQPLGLANPEALLEEFR